MNIGIIVYSHSGNTLSVAEKLEKTLIAGGHHVAIERVEPVSDDLKPNVQLKTIPDTKPYDIIIFASPVQAFSLAAVMKLYLAQVADLSGKKVYCFVTQQLKKPWLGGNRAVKQITAAVNAKGAQVMQSGIVNWSGKTKDKQIEDIVTRLSTL